MSKLTAATLAFVWFVGIAALAFMGWLARRELARGEREIAAAERDERREARELARDKREQDAAAAAVPHESAMLNQAVTNAFSAQITLTNTSTTETRYACVVAVVTHKKTGLQAKSLEVCSGPVAPHSSVTVQAPYQPDAVSHLCTDDEGRFTWDACSFEPVRAN